MMTLHNMSLRSFSYAVYQFSAWVIRVKWVILQKTNLVPRGRDPFSQRQGSGARCPFRWTKQRGLWERDWTGCRESKTCEESTRTLKNPFAPRLAAFNITLKLPRIIDQWHIVPVKFRFGRNRDFLALLLLPLAGGPKDGKRFDVDWRLIFSASFHTSSYNCERNMQK